MARAKTLKPESDFVRTMILLEPEIVERLRYYLASRGESVKLYRGINDVLARVLPSIPEDMAKLKRLPVPRVESTPSVEEKENTDD